jgi:hypothetical protein
VAQAPGVRSSFVFCYWFLLSREAFNVGNSQAERTGSTGQAKGSDASGAASGGGRASERGGGGGPANGDQGERYEIFHASLVSGISAVRQRLFQ